MSVASFGDVTTVGRLRRFLPLGCKLAKCINILYYEFKSNTATNKKPIIEQITLIKRHCTEKLKIFFITIHSILNEEQIIMIKELDYLKKYI